MKKFLVIIIFLFAATSASADTLGQNHYFFISSSYDAQRNSQVSASLRYVSDHAYFYVADNYWNDISVSQNHVMNDIQSLAQEFDNRIYPVETQFFGSEPNPGIDGDSRITILLTPLIENAGGYYDTSNEFPMANVSNSNQREIIYVNVIHLAERNRIYPFLAHEFQHLISYNQREKLRNLTDDVWINEMRSDYAPTLLGYNENYAGSYLERRVNTLIDNPSDSLTEWKNTSADYAQINLFGEYLAEHWSAQSIAGTIRSVSTGVNSIIESLSPYGFSGSFLDLYRNWLVALFLNNSLKDQNFGYLKPALASMHVPATRILTNILEGINVTDSIKDWQGRWYDIPQLQAGAKNILKITFTSPSLASFNISYLLFKPDNSYQIYSFDPAPASNILYVAGIGTDVSRVVVMPIKRDKIGGFLANETAVQLTFSVERVASGSASNVAPIPQITPTTLPSTSPSPSPVVSPQPPKPNLPDGTLIRARGDYKVYVIRGSWRRHITSAKIFSFYPGLGFERVREVEPSMLLQYKESNLVRVSGSKMVYAIDSNGGRHWLNISGQQFSGSGRSWDQIYTINSRELQFYKVGSSISQ